MSISTSSGQVVMSEAQRVEDRMEKLASRCEDVADRAYTRLNAFMDHSLEVAKEGPSEPRHAIEAEYFNQLDNHCIRYEAALNRLTDTLSRFQG